MGIANKMLYWSPVKDVGYSLSVAAKSLPGGYFSKSKERASMVL